MPCWKSGSDRDDTVYVMDQSIVLYRKHMMQQVWNVYVVFCGFYKMRAFQTEYILTTLRRY